MNTEVMFLADVLAVVVLLWTIFVINRYRRDRRRVESELRGTQERLAVALDASNSAAWDWDIGRDEIFLSAAWARMLGAPGGESTVTPAALLALVHPGDFERVQITVQRALKGITSGYREEHRIRRVDGTWAWIISEGKVVSRTAEGRPLRIAGTNHDISERKAIELALKEHDERLGLALETSLMAGWEWDAAEDRFTWQDSPVHVAGPAPAGGYAGLQDMIHPEDLVRFIQTFASTAKSGEACRDEFRLTRTDARIIWILLRGRPVRDSSGKVVRVIGVVQDTSDLKAAEQALRDSERQMRLLINAVPAVIGYLDSGERIRFCNKAMAKMIGLHPDAAVGRSLREVFSDENYQQIRPYMLRALAGEEVHFERVHHTAHGPMDLSASYIPRYDDKGEVEGFYALSVDITELKRVDRMKNEFVSTVSHELRTPLTSIRGSLGVLAGGIAGPMSDKAKGFIEIARNNCERLIRLINDILDMEKIESGKMIFQSAVLELMEVIEQAVKANDGFAAQHKVRLRVVAGLPGTKVYADGDRLAQVLTNFISNACKFSPADSSVDVSVTSERGRVRVDVADHGPGIPDEFRKRIFQKFSQADSSDVRKKGGTGLGLSISKAIIEGLGGEVGFQSEAGQGTTFHFDLPEWHAPVITPAMALSGRPRVLVCEDDADVGHLLRIMADRAGCDADLARSAGEAKKLLHERGYAAMTLDLGLPDQDGLSLLRDLRADAEAMQVPVIVVSAVAEAGRLKIGSEALGVLDWLDKPIDEARLLADLRSAVRGDASRLRVLHVEDDVDVRNVVATIARGVAEFDAAESLAIAGAKLRTGRYDLVLLDLGLPDGSGWDLLPVIERIVPRPRVVIFSASNRESRLPGATFLVKSQTTEQQLIDAIKVAVGRPE